MIAKILFIGGFNSIIMFETVNNEIEHNKEYKCRFVLRVTRLALLF